MMIRVTRYKRRYWAVWKGDELVAVVLYRKGAETVAGLLSGGRWQRGTDDR